MNKLDIKSTTE